MKEFNKDEVIWKHKYQKLEFKIRDLSEGIEYDNESPTNRAFLQSKRIYVNFDIDVCDTKKFADEHWGEGNYDVYDLNIKLSPFDKESDDA